MAPRAGREPPSWVVLPRRDVLDAAAAALADRAGHAGIVIVGEPGVGKTTVARAVALAAAPSCRWAVGTETGRDIPLGAFGHLLTSIPDARDRLSLLTTARRLLADDESDGVLVVDDAHLLDPLSATLLHQLVLARSVRAVVTLRSGTRTLDATTSLWKDGLLTRLELGALSRAEVDDLLTEVLPGSVESVTADRIWEASEGNPLLVRSLVTGAVESGALRQVRDVWQLRGPAAVTSEIEELFTSRLDALGPAVHHVVELLAFGGPLSLTLLQEMADPHAIEEAEQHDLIRLGHTGGGLAARLAHTMLGEVVRALTGAARSGRLRRELAGHLAPVARSAPDRLRVATLLLDSQTTVPPVMLGESTMDALNLGDLDLADRLSREAVEQGAGFESAMLRVLTLSWLGRGEDADAQCVAMSDPALPVDERTRLAVVRAANMHYTMRDPERAFAIIDDLRRAGDEGVAPALDAVVAMSQFFLGDPAAALTTAYRVLDQPHLSDTASVWAAASGVVAASFLGRFEECFSMVARWRSFELHPDTGLLDVPVALAECRALVAHGEFDLARDRAAERVDRTAGVNPAWAMALVVAGTVQCLRGDPSAARATLEQSMAAFETSAPLVWKFLAAAQLGVAQAQLGDAEAGAATLHTAEECFGPDMAGFTPDLELTRAWVAAAENDLPRARTRALHAADTARTMGCLPTEVAALHAHTRFGGRRSAPRLRELTALLDTPFAHLAATHATAFETDDVAALESVSREFEGSGELGSAAAASAQAAELYARRTDRKGEVAAAARAHDLWMRCTGGTLTPLADTARPLPLSDRELEIASLVASGLTNREIAERLVVSVRTVEGHLYRMNNRLGVHDRQELGRIVAGEVARRTPPH